MRIAFVYDAVYPETKGGVERRVWELARRLARRGHDVHLLVPNAWEGPDLIDREGVTLHGLCRRRALYTSRGRRAVWPAIAHAVAVLRFLHRRQFDLIDCQIPAHLATLAAWSVTRNRAGARCVVTWHEAWDENWVEEMGLLGHLGRRVERLVARIPTSHMAVSQHTADTLAGLGRPAEAVITAGVEPSTETKASWSAPMSDILFVGRLVPTKNLGLLIDATSLLLARGLRPRVLVIGEGPQRSSWELEADQKGLSPHIEFVGSLEDAADVGAALEATRVLALPSVREGFGMIALEAAAHGVPVVTVDHPRNAARHLVQHGVTGMCVPPAAADFAHALQALLENGSLRERLGAGGREVTHRSTWDSTVDVTESLYRARVA